MSTNPSRISKTAAVAFFVVIGFFAGWWGQEVSAPATEIAGTHAAASTDLPAEPFRAFTPSDPDIMSEPAVAENDSARILDEAEKRGERILPARTVVSRFSHPAIRSGVVSDAVAELLQLTAAERAAADRAIATASERLQQLELARIELAAASDTEVVFQVGAFLDEGEAVRTAYREDLLRGMDAEAGELLWELTTKDVRYSDYWKSWGDEAKEVRFSIEPNELEPEDYWVKFSVGPAGAFTTPEGRQRFRSATMTNHRQNDIWSTYEQLAGRHQYLTHHLPEPVRSFFHPGSIREAAQ